MAKSTEYQLAIKIAGKVSSSFNSALGTATGALSTVGAAAAKAAKVATVAFGAATAAVGAFTKAAIDTGKEFDTAVSQIAATMGKSVDEIDALKQTAMQMGSTTAFTATQAAEGLNILAMAGLEADEQIAAIPHVLNLASAGALTLEQAASYTAGAVKGFSDSMDNAQYYADLIAKGATLANTSVEGLGEALGRSSATAAAYGQQAEGVTLALLRLADQNVTGEAAATALTRAMADLYAPTAGAQKALKSLGVSAYDSSGKARDFNDVVADLSAALSGMTDQEANAYAKTIFTTQGLNAFNKMTAASTDTLEKFTRGLQEAGGSAAAQAATQLDNLAGDMTLFSSAVDGAKLAVYEQLKPALRDFVQFGTSAVGQLTTAFQEGGIEGAIGALGDVLSQGLNMVIDLLPQAMNAGMRLLGALGQGILDNLPTITDAAVQAAVMLAEGMAQALPGLITGIIRAVGQFFTGIAEALPDLIPLALEAATETLWAIADGLGQIDIGPIIDRLMEGLSNAPTGLLDAALGVVQGLADAVVKAAPQIIPAAAQVIVQLIETLTKPEFLTGLVDAALKIIVGLADGLLKAIPVLIEAIPTIIQNLIEAILGAIPLIIDAGIQLLTSLVENLPAIISGIVEAIPKIIKGIVTALINAIPQIIEAGVRLLIALVENLPAIITGIIEAIPLIIEGIISCIGELIPLMIEAGIKLFVALVENTPAIIAGIIKAIPEIIMAILKALASLPKALISLFTGAWDGIKGVFSGVGDFFSGIWEKIKGVWNTVAGWFDENVIQPIVNFFAPIVERISGFFEGCWIIIQAIWKAVSEWFDTNVIQPVVSVFNTVVDKVSGFFSSLWESIKGIWATVSGWFDTNVIQPVVGFFSPIVETISGFFSNLWSTICGVWEAAGNWFSEHVVEPIKSAFQTVGDFVKGVFNGIIGFVEGMINHVIDAINGFIGGFNGIVSKAASFIGVDWDGIAEVSHVSLPRLAEGGIVTAPTILEAGEAGTEAIIPLGELWGQMQDFIGDAMSGAIDQIATVVEQLEASEMGAQLFPISDLLSALNLGDDDGDDDGDAPPVQIIYSPTNHYHFEGDAPSKEEIAGAEEMSQDEFNRRVDQYFRERQRTNFRG